MLLLYTAFNISHRQILLVCHIKTKVHTMDSDINLRYIIKRDEQLLKKTVNM